jgi:hypothetical protein
MKLHVPYLKLRNGRPRWEPGPHLRDKGFRGRDLKDDAGNWLPRDRAVDEANRLNAEVADWRAAQAAGRRPPVPKRAACVRTCRALYDKWVATPEFRLLAPATRKDYRGKAELWLADGFADCPVAALGRAVLKNYWRKCYDTRGHHMANGVLAVVRAMLTFALDEEWIEINPALNLGLKQPEARVAFWSAAKVAAFVATADGMPDINAIDYRSIGDAVVIALHSAQRQADVLAMPARIFGETRIALSQMKTNALVDAPMTPQLAARIASIRARWSAAGIAARAAVVIDERTGKAWDASAFRKAFRTVREEACRRHPELLEHGRFEPSLAELRYQDLRDTAVTRMAMAGCTAPEIASISGHSLDHVGSVMRHYLALNEVIAGNAIDKTTAWLQKNGYEI